MQTSPFEREGRRVNKRRKRSDKVRGLKTYSALARYGTGGGGGGEGAERATPGVPSLIPPLKSLNISLYSITIFSN